MDFASLVNWSRREQAMAGVKPLPIQSDAAEMFVCMYARQKDSVFPANCPDNNLLINSHNDATNEEDPEHET